jgi:hypothetical protein
VKTQTPTLPKPIARKLSSLRGHLRRIDLVFGLNRLLMVVLGFVVSTFVLDRVLDLPVAFRAVLLVLGAAVALFIVWRWLLRPLAQRRTDDELALLVERAHPELNDELISAVQFARGAATGGSLHHSPDLVGQVVAEAAERAQTIDFGRVASTSDLRRITALTLAVAAIVGGLFFTRQRDAKLWFDRVIMLRDIPWPRTVELEVSVEAPVIARGDDLTITARVLRGQPSRVVVVPQFERSGRAEPVPMVEARGEWRTTFDNVNEAFRFYVEGGDFRSRWYEIAVRARPKVEDIQIWLTHPEYTGLANTPEGEPLRDGNLKVPGGTLVRYRARATEPLKAADVVFGTAQAIADAKAPALNESGDRRDLTGEFRVKDSTAWTVKLVSSEGFDSPVAGQYHIRAIPDKLPEVRVVKPGRNKDVAKAATVPLKIEVRDDYLPKAAALVYTVGGPKRAKSDADKEARVVLAGLPTGDGAKSVTIEHGFDLSAIGVEVGDRLTYWVEAVDNRAPAADVTSVAPESRGKSERYQLTVIADDELERQQQTALKRLGDDLIAVTKAQKATQTDLEGLAQELSGRDKPDPRDRRRLTYAELDQRKVAQRLEAARQSLDDVRDEMAANKVGKEEDIRWVAGLAADVERIVKEPVAKASTELQALRTAEKPEAAKILDVAKAQAEVVEGLQGIIKSLAKWDEVNEVVRDLRDLIRIQEDILKGTQQKAKEELKK